METVFTLTEVHSIPFLKTQDSLGLFTTCLLSVGPEVQRNFLYHKRHTRRMDAAGRWQGSQEGSHGDGDELQSTCALHRGQPLPSSHIWLLYRWPDLLISQQKPDTAI